MILCVTLLACVLALAAIVLWLVWEHQQIEGLESIAEHQETMQALNPRWWA